jgi:hypothetical protein
MKTGETRKESAVDNFRAAVHAFSSDPSSRNLVRYLMASQALELSRSKVPSKPGMPRRKACRVQAA